MAMMIKAESESELGSEEDSADSPGVFTVSFDTMEELLAGVSELHRWLACTV